MKLFLAVNSTNISMLYAEFKSMSEEAKKMKIYLAGLNGRKKLLLSGESEHRER